MRRGAGKADIGLGPPGAWRLAPVQERQSFFVGANFSKYVGMDVTSLLSVPVWIMEPFSVTQKVTEIMEYSELMDLANDAEDPFMR